MGFDEALFFVKFDTQASYLKIIVSAEFQIKKMEYDFRTLARFYQQ